MLSRIKKRHIALLSLLVALAIASALYLKNDQAKNGANIRPFNEQQDFSELRNIINANKFWLTDRPDFAVEKFLSWRAPNFDPSKKGQANIDVVEVDGVAGGFVAYYRKSPVEGFIWILAVDEKYRKRGFGELLVNQAISELKKSRVSYISIATRIINKPALGLYQKLGFIETSRDEDQGIIRLIKRDL